MIALGEHSLLFVVRGPWQNKMRRAVETFTPNGNGEYKDLIDATSGLHKALVEHEFPAELSWSF